jgi:tetratricopeptide (TPR) repeat protein
MKTEIPGEKSFKTRSKNYFVLAAVFFLLMALAWSVDKSLVYIFLGFASFFLFLGFFNMPSAQSAQTFRRSASDGPGRDLGKGFGIADALRTIFQQKNTFSTANTSVPQAAQVRKIVLIAIAFISVIALVPVLVVSFNSGGGTYDAGNYYSIAEQQYLSQAYDSAYVNYRRAISLNPDYAEAIVGYGDVLVVRNEKDSAIIMYNRALEINPDYKEADYKIGLVLYDQKKYDEGISLLATVLEENPEYYDGMLLMGDFYYIQEKYDDAIQWYENAYQNVGARSRILCHIMAFIYDNKGDYEKAISLYQEALNYDSSVVDIYQRLGELIQGENGDFYRSRAIELKRQL